MLTLEEVIYKLKKTPWAMSNGSGQLAKNWHTTPDIIKKAKETVRNEHLKVPKILIFDVETAPMRAYVWGRWKQTISLSQTISEWYMLCWSAKWLYSTEVISDKLTSEEALREDDKRLVTHLWELVNEADIVVAYNGKRADIPWMNTRFIVNQLPPPASYHVIDPFETAKKYFGFSSNKLDALAGYFGIEHKMDTDFELWDKAVKGSEEALNYMSTYCGKDVTILEEVYLRLRPFMKNHPNIGNFCSSTVERCSSCGSTKLVTVKDKYYFTSVGKYKLYRCKDCGAVSRGRNNLNKWESTKTKTVAVCH